MTPNGAKELAAALANKTKLQKLNLRENELEDRGVTLLSGPIQSLPALRILDLAQNQVCSLGLLPWLSASKCTVYHLKDNLLQEWRDTVLLLVCLSTSSKPILDILLDTSYPPISVTLYRCTKKASAC